MRWSAFYMRFRSPFRVPFRRFDWIELNTLLRFWRRNGKRVCAALVFPFGAPCLQATGQDLATVLLPESHQTKLWSCWAAAAFACWTSPACRCAFNENAATNAVAVAVVGTVENVWVTSKRHTRKEQGRRSLRLPCLALFARLPSARLP